jgi:O-antigen ligase
MLPSLTTIAMVGAGLQLWLTANTEVLLSLMGKDATLTGRTELWASVLDMIWKKTFAGLWVRCILVRRRE